MIVIVHPISLELIELRLQQQGVQDVTIAVNATVPPNVAVLQDGPETATMPIMRAGIESI